MKLNKEKFMKTEMGGELEETIRTWDKAIDERRKATPGIGNPDQGLGFKYWDNTCRSCQDRWEVFKLAIKQFYGIEFFFTRTDEYFGVCSEDERLLRSWARTVTSDSQWREFWNWQRTTFEKILRTV